jgi:hypothetical protein
MKHFYALLAALVLVVSVLFARPVFADSSETGLVETMGKVQPGSDNYDTYSGFILMQYGAAIYYGGTRCPTGTFGGPTTTDLQIIHAHWMKGYQLIILYKTYNGYRCFTGFSAL